VQEINAEKTITESSCGLWGPMMLSWFSVYAQLKNILF
jgi:hypothetical protein